MMLAASRPSEAARSPHVGRSVPAPFKWPESSGRFLRRLHSAHSLPSTGLRRPGRGDDTMETMKQMPTEPVKPMAGDGRKHRASVEEDAVRCARAELGEAT